MSDEIVAGDTVKLKSGSPNMTVTTVGDRYGTPTVWTVWFDGMKKLNAEFPPEALEKTTAPKSSVDLI